MEVITRTQKVINYNKINQKRINLAFYPSEHDLYEWLHSKPNSNGFIKELLRQAKEKELTQK